MTMRYSRILIWAAALVLIFWLIFSDKIVPPSALTARPELEIIEDTSGGKHELRRFGARSFIAKEQSLPVRLSTARSIFDDYVKNYHPHWGLVGIYLVDNDYFFSVGSMPTALILNGVLIDGQTGNVTEMGFPTQLRPDGRPLK